MNFTCRVRFFFYSVDTSYKLSNKFIEDFERIIEFIEHRDKLK